MFKVTNKIVSFFLIFSMVFPTLIGGLFSTGTQVFAAELGGGAIIDSVKMEKTDLYNGERVGISVTFSEKEGIGIKNGDTITMSLPPELIGIVSSAELKDPATGKVLGEAKIVNDQVICTFNSTAEELINVKGYFYFKVRVDSQKEGTISKTTDFGVNIPDIDYTVTYEKGEAGNDDDYPFFSKYGYMSEDGSNKITWQVIINQPKKELVHDGTNQKLIEVDDTSAADQTLLADSFRYFIEDKDKNFTWISQAEFSQYGTLEIDPANGNHFNVKLFAKEISNHKFGLVYDTHINDLNKKEFANDYTANYQITGEDQTIEKNTSYTENNSAGGGGSGDLPEKGSARLVKSLENKADVLLPGITFELFNAANQSLGSYQTDDQGQINVKNMELGQYYFKEVSAPEQFDVDQTKQYPFEIKENSATGELIPVTNKIKKTSLNLTKVWVGPETTSIDVRIYADGQDINRQVTIEKASNWQLLVTNLDKYNVDGSLINYTVQEVNVPAGYESVVTGNNETGLTITNTNIEKLNIPVIKKWQGEATDSVEVSLKRNNKITDKTIQLSPANNWRAEFTDLAKYDSKGKEISYSVVEAELAGYVATYTGNAQDGFTITNTRSTSITIPVTKKWVGPVGKPATVELFSNGVTTGRSVKLTANQNWTSAFTNLPEYDENGQEINYTLKEIQQENYDATITGSAKEGFTVTNTNNEKMTIPVKKEWFGPVGEKVIIRLLADGVDTSKSLELTSQKNWQGAFTDLPKYTEAGEEISYTIKEDKLENYFSLIDGNAKEGFLVTNINSEQVDLPVKKKWQGEKKDSVKIYAQVNGLLLPDVFIVLSEENNWEGTIDYLPKYDSAGELFHYTVVEEELSGYVTTYAGDQDTGYTVTNTRADSTSIPVTKKWVGPVGGDVVVKLFANGKDTAISLTLQANQNWEGKFTNLPTYDDKGIEIKYTVEEIAQENYESSIKGNSTEGFVITNTNKEETSIPVKKVWNGPEKDAITVFLYNDKNVKIKEMTINEAMNWQASFDHLPKYNADGKAINYFIREENMENYRPLIQGSKEAGYTINNINTEKVAVSVTKKWVGPIAGRVQVNLVKNGQMLSNYLTLDQTTNWQGTFSELEKYQADGTENKYTIVETVGYKNYDAAISGTAETGYTVTNTNSETITIPVAKEWVGPIGESATIELFRDSETTPLKLVLNADNDWKGEFADLPKYDDAGNEYNYQIKEVTVANYEREITGDSETGFVVTNTNIEKIKIPVTKKWIGPAAENVTIQLKQNDILMNSELLLNAENNWQGTFVDLPKYDEFGEEYQYTLTEKDLENYRSEITGTPETGFVVTNRNCEKIQLPVKKKWIGKKADEVQIKLMKNGVPIEETLSLNEENQWQGEFTDLPKYDDAGVENQYTVIEEELPGYQSEITGDVSTGFTVTNRYLGTEENPPNPSRPELPNTGDLSGKSELVNELGNQMSVGNQDHQLPKTNSKQENYLWLGVLSVSLGMFSYGMCYRKMGSKTK
ncbi:Cna B-type domain-containing protein [Carnobacterium sp.]|uniref:Cna B-type domain-containing protein n=2 Tax=Carnobacterium sp. TaxID=48221 RepID=UPI002FC7EF84